MYVCAGFLAPLPGGVPLAPHGHVETRVQLETGQFTCFRMGPGGADVRIEILSDARLLRKFTLARLSKADVLFCYLAPRSTVLTAVAANTGSAPEEIPAISFDAAHVPGGQDLSLLAAQDALAAARLLAAQKTAAKATVRAAFQEAVEKWQATGDSYRTATAHRALADVLKSQQESALALSEYAAAIALFEKGNWDIERAVALENLAAARNQLGQYREAINACSTAIGVYRGSGDRLGEAYARYERAQSWWHMGRYQTALTDYQASLDLWRDLGNRDMQAQVLNARGLIDVALGRYETASRDYRSAESLWRADGSKQNLLMVANNRGLLLLEQGRYREARVSLSHTFEMVPADDLHSRAYILQNLADTFAGAGSPVQAAALYRQSIAMKASLHDVEAEAESHRKLALVLMRMRQFTQARDEAATALSMSRSVFDRVGEAQSLATAATVRKALGDVAGAAADIGQAIALIEATRLELKGRGLRTSFFARERDFYDAAIDLALEPGGGGVREAFEWSERSRARALLDATGAIQPSGAAEIQTKLLTPGDVLVEYAINKTRSLAFVVTPSRVRVVRLSMAEPGVASVWWPLRITDARRVIVAPEAGLARLAFSAFPLQPGNSRLLIDQCEIVLIPSASFILGRRRARGQDGASRERSGVAVFADPIFSASDPRLNAPAADPSLNAPASGGAPALGRDLVRLRFSLEEALTIKAAAGPEVQVFTGAAASATGFHSAAGKPGAVLHIATHTAGEAANPHLVFSRYAADGSEVSSDVGLDELYRLGVRRDLVVLAGCRTAAGESVRGEGLASLAQGFLYAGALAVISTLRDIDDRTSAEVTKDFYTDVFRNRLSPAAALRAAQLKQRRGGSGWTAFTYMGDWSI
jgi:tetratricopeptide (TPR) repeat protein